MRALSLALSHPSEQANSNSATGTFLTPTPTRHASLPAAELFFKILAMAALLKIASRVEAAVEAYVSVRDFAVEQEWREKFRGEVVSSDLDGVSIDLHLK